MLDHLGPPIESWWADLGTPHITEDLKATLCAGLDEALRERDRAALAPARDALLAGLIEAKAGKPELP